MADTLIADRYVVKHQIGRGSFGEIFLGIDIMTGESVAIKVESLGTKYPQLLYEYRVYLAMKGAPGLPNVRWCGTTGKVNVMVMDLLGDSLETLYNKCGRCFSLKTVLMLAVQLLDRIQHQHEHHYLHRDIKPDNFLMGLPPNPHILYLIDMGLSKRYRDPVTLQHIPYRDKKRLTGTPRYASINTHRGLEQCRRDDLESMGYMLLYFLNGRLPWQGLKARTKQEKYDKIGQKKVSTTIEELCRGQPREFRNYLEYARGLDFTEEPDYRALRCLFTDLFRQKGYEEDWIFDWMLLPEYKNSLPPLDVRKAAMPRIPPPLPAAPKTERPAAQDQAFGSGQAAAATPNAPNATDIARTGEKIVLIAQLRERISALEAERDQWKRKSEDWERQAQTVNAWMAHVKRELIQHYPSTAAMFMGPPVVGRPPAATPGAAASGAVSENPSATLAVGGAAPAAVVHSNGLEEGGRQTPLSGAVSGDAANAGASPTNQEAAAGLSANATADALQLRRSKRKTPAPAGGKGGNVSARSRSRGAGAAGDAEVSSPRPKTRRTSRHEPTVADSNQAS